MTAGELPTATWVQRAVERSASVQRSRTRIATQMRQILDAAISLIAAKGEEFTTQELAGEAGVALQTFYRHFTSKDELLLAVIGDAMVESCASWADGTGAMTDPVERLRHYLGSTLGRLDGDNRNSALARFIVTTRWRLHRQFPGELAEAERPFVNLLRHTVAEATSQGRLRPADVEWDSWLIGELVRAVYHHYAFAADADTDLDVTKERLWAFSLAALGGPEEATKGLCSD